MKSKQSKYVLVSLLLGASLLTGCGGTARKGKNAFIKANTIGSSVEFQNVSFYDFCTKKLQKKYCKQGTVIGGGFNGTEIWFQERGGRTRMISVDKPLVKKPKVVCVYQNAKKSASERYTCSY